MGSINVANLYDERANDVDWSLFDTTIQTAIRFLDDVIDNTEFVLPEFEAKMKGNRKIGLGIAGFAELLIKLGIRYDSEECLKFIDILGKFFKDKTENYDIQLAREKGMFPNWKDSIYGVYDVERRNATITTQAPTGSIATILGTQAYGIEPLFAIRVIRRIVTGNVIEDNELFKKMLHEEINNAEQEESIMQQCSDKGTTNLDCVPNKLRELFRCANDISPEWHIKVMAELQKYYENAISKTINLPQSATKDDVRNVYKLAFELGCKGCTVYRNNSRDNQTMQIGNKDKKYDTISKTELPRGFIEEVPEWLTYRKYKIHSGCGKLYFFVGLDEDEGKIYDCFTNTDGTSGCTINTQANSRLLSAGLRGGIPIEYLIEQLEKAGTCPSYQYARGQGKQLSPGKSCSSAIARVLRDILKEFKEDNEETIKTKVAKVKKDQFATEEKQFLKDNGEIAFALKYNKCPECGNDLEHVAGCLQCQCGWSKCS